MSKTRPAVIVKTRFVDAGSSPQIDQLTRYFLHHYCADAFAEFQRECQREQTVYERAYGGGSRYQEYTRNKVNDLYKRMGNVILGEMREYSKHEVHVGKGCFSREYQAYNHANIGHSLFKLCQALSSEFLQHRLNLSAYYQMQSDLSLG